MFDDTYEQQERLFHRDIQTRENNDIVWKPERLGRVFLLIVFECLDGTRVGHKLELFIWLLKWNNLRRNRMFSLADLNKIINQA
jgi:hypothetical protein